MKYLICFFIVLFSAPLFAYNPAQLSDFQNTKICEGCDFNSLNLSEALLGNQQYNDAILTKTYMYGSSIEHLNLQRLKAKGLIAVGLLLHDNDLTDADFSYAELPHIKITQENKGDYIRFTGSQLDHSDFSFTSFESPDLSAAAMRYVLLYRVEWPHANLSNALLYAADLTFANLQEANLENADLTNAVMSHADLSRANLLNAKISENQFKQVLSVCDAIMPDGSIGQCRYDTKNHKN